MISAGTLPKILNKICTAAVPENFNADFLGTKLGFPGGNQRAFISWAKKCGLLNSDGTPTQIYKNFRNPDYRGLAMANALRHGYAEVYVRNEYCHELERKPFTKLISEITGSPHDNSTVKAIVSSFFNAKEFADFEAKADSTKEKSKTSPKDKLLPKTPANEHQITEPRKSLKLGLNYTINLVLPKTDDPAIYDAIFKSLKENLLDE
ncbi:MAG: DUF5343 domain-containing protein [Bacteroidia bacterium]